ncbi:MAG TPA: TonB-dependent receptor plug domain-containing protein, partial [Bacteroidales bacterium]|nr:TonB-dependent receptor plug domain-containing protein [Bacteroidales bacterium]
ADISHLTENISVISKGEGWSYREANKEEIEQARQQMIDKENAERNDLSKIYGHPDNVLYMKDIPPGYSNLLQVIQGRIPGVVVTGNSIVIRGINSFYLSSDPLILIDGVPSNMGAFRTISPEDVERIEVLKGASASIYGSRGANGVIAVYTKRGQFMKKGVLDFEMLGYYKPREFYVPKYNNSTPSGTNPDMRPTVYWNPEILTDSEGKATFSFFTSDARNKFNVIVQGTSENGLVGTTETEYQVE